MSRPAQHEIDVTAGSPGPDGVPWMRVPGLDRSEGGAESVSALITLRQPTVMAPREALAAVAARVSWMARLATAEQVHGADVATVDAPGEVGGVDALVTRQAELALAIRVADCAPVLLVDPGPEGAIAAAHAGWRGAAGGILTRTVRRMAELGGVPDRILAWVGPCIGVNRFRVGEEVAERFAREVVVRTPDGPHVDLGGAVRRELLAAGLRSANVLSDGRCTFEHAGLWHSHRRDGERAGRMWAVIAR